ncbi:helix-turn-helix domain-containing protein [Ammoniphilus sp. 3BR4]|uniref:helix-turn-helix domain-containing protein n=1 Tax=Ammoniphilus sp. 3BR4 TaxID=3158265 RepID=UPI003466CD4A
MILERLTDLRKRKKWSLQYIADQLGIAKSTYAGYESGYRQPSLEAIVKLANLLDTSVDYLFGRVDDPLLEPGQTIELTDLEASGPLKLCVDEKCLSEDEVKQVIAFIRTKRELG